MVLLFLRVCGGDAEFFVLQIPPPLSVRSPFYNFFPRRGSLLIPSGATTGPDNLFGFLKTEKTCPGPLLSLVVLAPPPPFDSPASFSFDRERGPQKHRPVSPQRKTQSFLCAFPRSSRLLTLIFLSQFLLERLPSGVFCFKAAFSFPFSVDIPRSC